MAKSGDCDGEDHRSVHLAHCAVHPHRGGVHQPLHLPPHHLAHGCCWLSRCNSWVIVNIVSALVKRQNCRYVVGATLSWAFKLRLDQITAVAIETAMQVSKIIIIINIIIITRPSLGGSLEWCSFNG